MRFMKRSRCATVLGIVVAALALVVSSAPVTSARTVAVAPSAPPAAPNEVTRWNEIAQTTVLAQPPNASAPPAAAVFLAMVQGAVFAGVNAIDGRHRPYLLAPRPRPHASKDAAVATAAYRVLVALFPAQQATLEPEYDASLSAIPDGPKKDAGVRVGEAAAAAMLAQGHDGRLGPTPPLPPQGPRFWAPLLDANNAPLLDPSPWVALAKPFLLRSPSQFRSAGPFELTSAAYARDFAEVKSLGDVDSVTRTEEQTHTAIFWQSNPAATWNGVARRLADERGLGVSDTARLFALLDLSAADASINCWNDKYHFGFWRPIAAIREADTDRNTATEPDTTWAPLFTPPYPDHPSGHLCFSTSSLTAMARFFGTDSMSFYVTSAQFPGEQRPFDRFSDAVRELLDARVWAGLHFRNADEQGALLGARVARYAHLRWFQ